MRCPDCDTLGTRPCPTHYASHNQEDETDMEISALREQVARLTAERDELRERQSRVWTWGMEPGAVPVPAVVEFDSKATSELRERLAQAEREREHLEFHLAQAMLVIDLARTALMHCKHRPHEHNPGPEFTVTHCDVIDSTLVEVERVLSSPGSRKEGA